VLINRFEVRYLLTCKIFLSATCTLDATDKRFSHKLLLYFAFFVKWVKSLTYLPIFREYKPWFVLLITQWSKTSKILALSLGLFDLQCLLPFIIRKHSFNKLLLYFAFFVKLVVKSDLSMPKVCKKSCLPFLVSKRQRRSQLSHLIGYIKGHLKLWVCLTLQYTVLWMVRGIASECSLSQNNKKHYFNIFS
jgi:hypothetical protein